MVYNYRALIGKIIEVYGSQKAFAKADAANIGKAIEETVDAVDVIKKETKKVDKKA